jgi:hypothetical protein
MAKEIRADPVELARLARATLDASIGLGDGLRGAQGPLDIPLSAFGNATVAGSVHASHQAACDDADTAVGRLVAVYEGDVDNLYQVAFAYQKADQDAAARERPRQRHGGPQMQ